MSREILRIGMLHPVAAPITTEAEGQAITYGTGMVVGNAVSAEITWNRADTSHYGDDMEDARDNGILSGNISFVNSGIAQDVRIMLLGESQIGTTGVYEIAADASPYVGFGYARVLRKNGDTTYEALWLHKVQFAENTISDSTKGESIEWGETTLDGRIMGVRNDQTLATRYNQHKEFASAADAIAWLDGKANISSSSSSSSSSGTTGQT